LDVDCPTLTPKPLRARAHALNPVVSIGHHGLSPAVLHEIDVALLAHELIKIRIWNDDRAERESLCARICAELDAAPVQHIGKLVVVWRPAPEPESAPAPPAPRRKAGAAPPAARPARGKPKPMVAAAGSARGKPKPRTAAAGAGRREPAAGPAATATRRRYGSPQGRAAGTAPAAPGSRPPRRRRAP
jgi:putative YhbY family RNA-binding protein